MTLFSGGAAFSGIRSGVTAAHATDARQLEHPKANTGHDQQAGHKTGYPLPGTGLLVEYIALGTVHQPFIDTGDGVKQFFPPISYAHPLVLQIGPQALPQPQQPLGHGVGLHPQLLGQALYRVAIPVPADKQCPGFISQAV